MTKSILKVVVLGILVGAGAFFMPKVLVVIFIIGLLIRLFCCGRGRGCCGHRHHHGKVFYMADKIRKMSDAEYAEFKSKMGGGCCDTKSSCGCGCNCGSDCKCGPDCNCGPDCKCGCKTESKSECCCESKKEESK